MNMANIISSALIFLLYFGCTFSARILLLPGEHPGHVNIFCVAGEALMNQGHEVYLLTYESNKKRVEKSGIKPLIHIPDNAVNPTSDATFQEEISSLLMRKPSISKTITFLKHGKQLNDKIVTALEEMVSNKELNEKIRELKFDFALIDGSPPIRGLYTIVYKYDIPYITLNPAIGDPWGAHVPSMPSVEPLPLLPYSNQMSYFERLINFLSTVAFSSMKYLTSSASPDYFIQNNVPEKTMVSLADLYGQSAMIITNVDVWLMDYPRVSAPHYIYISSTGGSPPKPLEKDLDDFVSSAENGIVLVSFGSIVRQFSEDLESKLFRTFTNFPDLKFVMRYAGKVHGSAPVNVKLMKWLPQNDLAGNPKTRVFITHSGKNGITEAIYHGVPMVVAPVMADQYYNAHNIEVKKYGKKIDIHYDTSDDITSTLKEVLENPVYRKNTMKAKVILKDLPRGNETIAYWVNHILQFGSDHLHPSYTEMPLYKFFMLDILAFIVFISIISMWFTYKCVKLCCGTCCKRKYKQE